MEAAHAHALQASGCASGSRPGTCNATWSCGDTNPGGPVPRPRRDPLPGSLRKPGARL